MTTVHFSCPNLATGHWCYRKKKLHLSYKWKKNITANRAKITTKNRHKITTKNWHKNATKNITLDRHPVKLV